MRAAESVLFLEADYGGMRVVAFFIPMGGPQAHAKLGSCPGRLVATILEAAEGDRSCLTP